ncbi:hypothetical protein [Spirosoma endbachense]|jgi:hypothetical protein|uniref:Uncharacterized protein n=1 Tax=Spirosoma endbachense TaxID=2666025 RepID=A0A6P1VRB8_9BACT|nr:hypothetical protein [Spirosoma endbachense]QHV94948.1 hypothetical protein GJR95_07905 [Spirosoma endbachense]
MLTAKKYGIRLLVDNKQILVKSVGGNLFHSKYWEFWGEYDETGRLIGHPVRSLVPNHAVDEQTDEKITLPIHGVALDVAEIVSQQLNSTAYVEAAIREKYARDREVANLVN